MRPFIYSQKNFMIDTFLFIRILNRFHTEIFIKHLYFRKKLSFIQTRYRQNQHLWWHFGDKMSPENQGVFQFLKEVTFWRVLVFLELVKMGAFWGHLFTAQYAWWAGGTGSREFGNEGRIYQSVSQAPPRTLQRFVRKFFMAFISPRWYN